jgi:hypothetical protein
MVGLHPRRPAVPSSAPPVPPRPAPQPPQAVGAGQGILRRNRHRVHGARLCGGQRRRAGQAAAGRRAGQDSGRVPEAHGCDGRERTSLIDSAVDPRLARYSSFARP